MLAFAETAGSCAMPKGLLFLLVMIAVIIIVTAAIIGVIVVGIVAIIAIIIVYTIAKVISYNRLSQKQWEQVDKSKLKEWDDDDSWD